jgi:hypothetical protein
MTGITRHFAPLCGRTLETEIRDGFQLVRDGFVRNSALPTGRAQEQGHF